MNRDDVIRRLQPHLDELRARGVRSLELFGSVARGQERPESDVDLLVQFDPVPGLLEYLSIKHRLEDLLGRPVDLVMASGLKAALRERVLAEATRVA